MKASIEEIILKVNPGTTIDEAFDYVKNLVTNPNFKHLHIVTFDFNNIRYTIKKETAVLIE